MLPAEFAIPFFLLGALVLAWAIWPDEITRKIQKLPKPAASRILDAIRRVEKRFDDSETSVVPEMPVHDAEKRGQARLVFDPKSHTVQSAQNVSSITDLGIRTFRINFQHPVDSSSLVVHPIGVAPRDFIVREVSKDHVTITYDGDPDTVAVRIHLTGSLIASSPTSAAGRPARSAFAARTAAMAPARIGRKATSPVCVVASSAITITSAVGLVSTVCRHVSPRYHVAGAGSPRTSVARRPDWVTYIPESGTRCPGLTSRGSKDVRNVGWGV